MKNLFYVCLIAIVLLGSTGFTTVEEIGRSDSEILQRNCFDESQSAYDTAINHGWNHNFAMGISNMVYENCIYNGGSPGSQEPVVIIAE
jgi:hypothetical protein